MFSFFLFHFSFSFSSLAYLYMFRLLKSQGFFVLFYFLFSLLTLLFTNLYFKLNKSVKIKTCCYSTGAYVQRLTFLER